MKNLKLLNKKYLLIILFSLFFGFNTQSQEPVDIWNVKETKTIGETSIAEIMKMKILLKIVSIKCNLKKKMKQI